MKTIFSVSENDMRTKKDVELVYNLISKEEEMTFDELVEELTPAKKQLVLSAIELYRRSKSKNKSLHMLTSLNVYEVMQPLMDGLIHEEFWVLYMDQSLKITKRMRISSGGVSETTVDIRFILKNAVLANISCIILCHNHPSGSKRPSIADDILTTKIQEASKCIGIEVKDHIIITDQGYYSYADKGRI